MLFHPLVVPLVTCTGVAGTRAVLETRTRGAARGRICAVDALAKNLY
jgi:hypothetical protein